MKKYVLSDSGTQFNDKTLYRIRAEVPFGKIQEGDLGGFVESEKNLTQEGHAWVSGNARISGDAKVSGNARISGNADVSGNAKILGNARITNNAWVYGDAKVTGNARVSGSAWVFGSAWVSGSSWVYGDAKVSEKARISGRAEVSGNAEIGGDAKVSKYKLINITGLKWNVTISDYHIQIGSEFHRIGDWKKLSDEKMGLMADDLLNWWKIYRNIILSVASKKLRRVGFVNG